MTLLQDLKTKRLYYDGSCGTYLQNKGLEAGDIPELLNLRSPDLIVEMHRAYLKAGADIILTNTFGANRLKFKDENISVNEVVTAAVDNAKRAVALSLIHI